jgi:hypothetical protein
VIQFLLTSHVLAGATALGSAFLAISTKKGSKNHIFVGRIYSLAMFYVVVGAFILSVVRPNPFLFTIALFSGYLVWTGFRRARYRNAVLNKVDKVTAAIGVSIILILFGYGLNLILSQNSIGIVLIFFGLGMVTFVFEDVRALKSDLYKSKLRIANHLQRMLGGTIATITAVLVQQLVPRIQNTQIPEFVIWIGPTIVLTPLIFYWSKRILS